MRSISDYHVWITLIRIYSKLYYNKLKFVFKVISVLNKNYDFKLDQNILVLYFTQINLTLKAEDIL